MSSKLSPNNRTALCVQCVYEKYFHEAKTNLLYISQILLIYAFFVVAPAKG